MTSKNASGGSSPTSKYSYMTRHSRAATETVGYGQAPDRRRSSRPATIGHAFGSIIGWLRAGYPDEAPRNGYSPLLALNGPVSLSARQTAQIVAQLRQGPVDPVDVGVTITKVTNKLPTRAQIRTVTSALPLGTQPQR